jgi:hypothetical protein
MALPPEVRPSVVAQNARVHASAPQDGLTLLLEPVYGVTQPAKTVSRDAFLSDFGEHLFMSTKCVRANDNRNAEVRAALAIWWREQFGLPLNGSSSIGSTDYENPYFESALAIAAVFGALDQDMRDAWLRENLPRLLSCRTVPGWA